MVNYDYYNNREFFFTSESVSEGHPDKVADQISDAILDAYLEQDPHSRVAVETLVTTNKIILAGEVRGAATVTKRAEEIARQVVRDIGYEQAGFNWKNLEVENLIHGQSADIAVGVDSDGAGDQGLMFGYACNETDCYMPAPIYYSHRLLKKIFADIKLGKLNGLGPDAKSQVTLRYKGNKPVGVKSVVLSIQHVADISLKQVKELIIPYIMNLFPKEWYIDENEIFINPTGVFIIGGPDGDVGLTGRKIIVDTYGGAAPHGGGAFSGKDPTKVDRSAAYMARYLAKNIAHKYQSDACTVQLSYAIGVAKPMALYVNLHGTQNSNITEDDVYKEIWENIDLTPKGIRTKLGLNKPIYRPTATYGHFGRKPQENGEFSWEVLDF